MTNQAAAVEPFDAALSLLRLLTAIVFCCAVSVYGQETPSAARPLPAGDGKAIVETACTACHELALITAARHTPADWKLLVERMVSAGAEVPKTRIAMVTEYLSKSFPEGNVPKATRRGLIQGLAMLTAASATESGAQVASQSQTGVGIQAAKIDHVSEIVRLGMGKVLVSLPP